jgi:anti-anti-sigma regulatory factor
MNGCDRWDTMNTAAFTTTLVEPVGDLTPDVARRLSEAVGRATRRGRSVVITLRSIARLSWAGLVQLSERLRVAGVPKSAVSFADVVPSVRSLLEQVGLGDGIVDRNCFVPVERIFIKV